MTGKLATLTPRLECVAVILSKKGNTMEDFNKFWNKNKVPLTIMAVLLVVGIVLGNAG